MPKIAKEMTPLAVKLFRKVGRHRAGGVAGLILQVHARADGKGVTKSWLLSYVAPGTNKRREAGLGSYPEVSLAEAREKASAMRDKIKLAIDPLVERDSIVAANLAAAGVRHTFKQVAALYLRANRSGWKNPKHAAQWETTLEGTFPLLGDLYVDDIQVAHVLKVLEQRPEDDPKGKTLWERLPETASRLRGRIEAVLNFAEARGYRNGANPARLKGALEHLLPKVSRLKNVRHHPAVQVADTYAFTAALRAAEGTAARALELVLYCAARSGEVRLATWGEIRDLDGTEPLWVIPKERMKAKREHRVPLNVAAVELLRRLKGEGKPTKDALIFASTRGTPLSDMALLQTMRRLGFKDAKGEQTTPHGLRSTFRDWAGEHTAFQREVIEQALAHGLKDETEAAYARGDLLVKRRKLMVAWAKHIETKPAAIEGVNVIHIASAA